MNNPPLWVRQAQDSWTNRGHQRPPFALEPTADQESVWDYPRPPDLRPDQRLVEVAAVGHIIASTRGAIRLCETSHAPSFYIQPDDCDLELLVALSTSASFCEWKGPARSWALTTAPAHQVGWDYPAPYGEYADIAGFLSFYPDRVECRVDGEVATGQPGGFYGGWITNDVVGPFKGGPESRGW